MINLISLCPQSKVIPVLCLFYTLLSHGDLTKKDLDLIHQQPWITLGAILGEKIKIINPSNDNFHDFNAALQIMHFVPPLPYEFIFFRKIVRSVDYITFYKDPRTYKKEMGSEYTLSLFIMHFVDGSHITFIPERFLTEGPVNIAETMYHLSIATKSEFTISHSFFEIDPKTHERKVNDYSNLATGNYLPKTSEFHVQMLITIYQTIISTVKSTPELLTKAKNGIQLIFLGCGNGVECLGGIAMLNQRLNVPVKACGIDINPRLIAAAKSRFPGIPFYVEDAAKAKGIIKGCLSENPGQLAIVVALGLLSLEVMTGTYPALQVFQQAADSGLVDRMYVAAYGMPLFNRYMVESSGWEMKITHIPHTQLHEKGTHPYEDEDSLRNRLYVMTPMSIEKQASMFISRSNHMNTSKNEPFTTLTLSLSSHPKIIFRHLKGKPVSSSVRSLDLSWSSIPDGEEREQFFTDLKKSGVMNIVASGFEPWFDDVEKRVRNTQSFNIYKRTDAKYPSEVPAITPEYARILLAAPYKYTAPYYQAPANEIVATQRQPSSETDPRIRLQQNLDRLGVRVRHFDPVTNTLYLDIPSAGTTQETTTGSASTSLTAEKWQEELQGTIKKSAALTGITYDESSAHLGEAPALQQLDLSSDSMVLRKIKHFLGTGSSQSITHIDLSGSLLKQHEIEPLINLLSGFPALKSVIMSGNESWHDQFISRLSASGHRIKRLVHSTADNALFPAGTVQSLTAKQVVPWTQDIESGYLSSYLLPGFHKELIDLLTTHAIQLQDTPADGLCFFHAVGMQLHISESHLRAALYNHLIFNSQNIQEQFPQFSGEMFNQLLSELLQGSWGDAGQAALISAVFNRRVILIYFHSQNGNVQILQLNPNGSSEVLSRLPTNLNNQDIILAHNGLGHWLAGSPQTQASNLKQHNSALLNIKDPLPASHIWERSEEIYNPGIFPALISILILAWSPLLSL